MHNTNYMIHNSVTLVITLSCLRNLMSIRWKWTNNVWMSFFRTIVLLYFLISSFYVLFLSFQFVITFKDICLNPSKVSPYVFDFYDIGSEIVRLQLQACEIVFSCIAFWVFIYLFFLASSSNLFNFSFFFN